jgi:hypothetical protein
VLKRAVVDDVLRKRLMPGIPVRGWRRGCRSGGIGGAILCSESAVVFIIAHPSVKSGSARSNAKSETARGTRRPPFPDRLRVSAPPTFKTGWNSRVSGPARPSWWCRSCRTRPCRSPGAPRGAVRLRQSAGSCRLPIAPNTASGAGGSVERAGDNDHTDRGPGVTRDRERQRRAPGRTPRATRHRRRPLLTGAPDSSACSTVSTILPKLVSRTRRSPMTSSQCKRSDERRRGARRRGLC